VEPKYEHVSLQNLVAKGKPTKKGNSADSADVGEVSKLDRAITAARNNGNSSALIAALECKIKELVSQHSPPNAWTKLGLGGWEGVYVYVVNVSYLPRPILRANGVDWLLAHLLSRMLVTLLGLNQTVSYMQTDHGCCRFAEDLLMIIIQFDTGFFYI
jgi:hypothetical protein